MMGFYLRVLSDLVGDLGRHSGRIQSSPLTTVEFGDDEHEPQCVRHLHGFIFSGDEIIEKKFLFVFLSDMEVRSSSSTMER
jgi:hypothetical protein